MERLEYLKNKHPHFKCHHHTVVKVEDLQLKQVYFEVSLQVPEISPIEEVIETLQKYKNNLPQAGQIDVILRGYEMKLGCSREETPEEFALRKEILLEENELYDLISAEVEKDKYEDDYKIYLKLSEKFKNGKDFEHYRRDRNSKGINSGEKNTAQL